MCPVCPVCVPAPPGVFLPGSTTRISAFLVWVSAFRVSALAFLLFDGEHPRNPRGHAMARPAVMPFKNVDGEPCFACGETENTRWYCAYDPARLLRVRSGADSALAVPHALTRALRSELRSDSQVGPARARSTDRWR